jgi:hypothetical protein
MAFMPELSASFRIPLRPRRIPFVTRGVGSLYCGIHGKQVGLGGYRVNHLSISEIVSISL